MLDTAVASVINDCTKGGNLFYTYDSCDRTKGILNPTSDDPIRYISTLPLYLRGTVGACEDAKVLNYDRLGANSIKLRNGVCLYPTNISTIFVDINGKEGPNDAMNQFRVFIDASAGVVTDMPQKPIFNWAGNIHGCAQNSGSSCTKCYCGYALVSGACKDIYDSRYTGCSSASINKPEVVYYIDSTCTTSSVNSFCTGCATQQLSSAKLYKKSGANCIDAGMNAVTCAPPADCEPM